VAKSTITKSENTDDVEMVLRAQKDPQAFKPLYEKYFKRIFLFVHHRVNDKAISADLTSQTFLKALVNVSHFKFVGVPFSAWLYRIALNECYDYFRKSTRNRHVSLEDGAIYELHEELTSETSLTDLHEKLPSILECLSIEEIQLLELRYFEQRPFKEVADILSITETHAKVRVYRLLDKMKKLFIKL
jgi:RNA polymerase sigma-70 factor (ECF subfamily)